jgi:hypothetical protein
MPPPAARQKAAETDISKLDGTDICTLGLHVWRWQRRLMETGVDGLLHDKTRKPGKAPVAARLWRA